MADPAPQSPQDDFVDVRPTRFKAKLYFWISLSLALHIAGGIALASSETLRTWLFASFLSKQETEVATSRQLKSSRHALDQLTRKRIIDCNDKMLVISRRVEELRNKEWEGVRTRSASNPHFQAMYDGGLPPIDMVREAGSTSLDVPALYARAIGCESQVIGLYEQYKAIGLSMMTVSIAKAGEQPKPQALSDSLDLARLERPERPALNLEIINATIEVLLQPGKWDAWKEEMTRASDTAEVMANNCQRVIDVVEKIVAMIEGGPASLVPGGGNDNWKENNDYRGESLRPRDLVPSDLQSLDKNAKITLGKHLSKTETGRGADWLAIDSWYWIGPFAYLSQTRDEQSLRHAYPPELGIDLDAAYSGKGGKPLRWQFRTMEQVRMEPRDVSRHSIWYFFAELHSDEERTVWCNVASDDYGSLWLNESREPIYTSGMDPRPWVILDQRQFCELKLRKGRNSILLKMDNNGGTTGFSVLFSLLPMQ